MWLLVQKRLFFLGFSGCGNYKVMNAIKQQLDSHLYPNIISTTITEYQTSRTEEKICINFSQKDMKQEQFR